MNRRKKKEEEEKRTRPYTRAEVVCGWAGAVMIKAYPSVWAGAKTARNAEEAKCD